MSGSAPVMAEPCSLKPSGLLERGANDLTGNASAFDVCIVGGCGRAGLPLAIAFAQTGLRVAAYDIDAERVRSVDAGRMPFRERGAAEALGRVLAEARLEATADVCVVGHSAAVVIVIGTPVDEFLNPSLSDFRRCVDGIAPQLADGTLVVVRSTVYPGTTEWLARHLAGLGKRVDVAVCPERIAEGMALDELVYLPQMIGADDVPARGRAKALFARLTNTLIEVTTREAELAKLLSNAWRYMKFAVANHFFMIAHAAGLDYGRILHAMRHDYPRAADLPGPGFAAGPCLLKDTLQLAAFTQNNFMLGQAAMVVNEGLPQYVVNHITKRIDLVGKTVGILGMAFKADSDDTRASLSYKLRKLLVQAGARVLCTDPYVGGDDIVPLEFVLREAEILIVATPHSDYRALDLNGREVVDVWGLVAPSIRL